MATPGDVFFNLLDEFWYVSILFASLLVLGAYGMVNRYNDANGPIDRLRYAIVILAMDIRDIVLSVFNLSKTLLFTFGIIGGSIIWAVFPFFQGDPIVILTSASTTYAIMGVLNIDNALAFAGLVIAGSAVLIFAVHFIGGLDD